MLPTWKKVVMRTALERVKSWRWCECSRFKISKITFGRRVFESLSLLKASITKLLYLPDEVEKYRVQSCVTFGRLFGG